MGRKKRKRGSAAGKIREAHSAGNAFERMLADEAAAAPPKKPQSKPKKHRRRLTKKEVARQARVKEAKIAALIRRRLTLTYAEAEAKLHASRSWNRWARKNQHRPAAAAKGKACQRAKSQVLDYAAYLRSAHWRAKRNEALEYHGAACDQCGTEDDLQVHHKTYARLGREKMKDLQILCADCHTKLHEADPKWVARQQKKAAASAAGG